MKAFGNKKVAVIGGGVIGGGWAARFALHGWTVQIYDPAPGASDAIHEIFANAKRSLPEITAVRMPEAGELVNCDSIEAAVEGASWVQESVPERLPLKHQVLSEIEKHVTPEVIIGSSTSGFRPSQLRERASEPDRIVVAHPFNPVYLLPLVELVAGDDANASVVEQAESLLGSIGMKPLRVRKEIDAHIADRLLEAVWRESLWLVRDGIATTEEIDDAIRMGFGLRWAQMGYRVAGGKAGMAHFIEQFGPCLSWPWTRLMDVPELSDELVQKIADQSDEQSGHMSIERKRDDNLIGILNVLKKNEWGAGNVLNAHDQQLSATVDSTSEGGQ